MINLLIWKKWTIIDNNNNKNGKLRPSERIKTFASPIKNEL